MSTDRVFLDANILFSISYGSSGLYRLWELAQKGSCKLIASRYVIEEAKRNLDRQEQLDKLCIYLSNVIVMPEADPTISCPIDLHEKDVPVLMAAIFAKADYLVTGDVAHFGKYFGQAIMGVNICRAREYISLKDNAGFSSDRR